MKLKDIPNLKASAVDVLLVLEGTYPLVKGGVSTWVEQLITSMPTQKFGILYIGSRPEDYKAVEYQLPDNLIYFQSLFLFGNETKNLSQKAKKDDKKIHDTILPAIQDLHGCFRHILEGEISDCKKAFELTEMQESDLFDEMYFLHSEHAWEYIVEKYNELSIEPSFIDYLWTVRNLHSPLWILNKFAKESVKAKMVHTASTGYAGLLGSLISRYQDISLLTTEHGIYTRERYLELIGTPLAKTRTSLERISNDVEYLNNLWLRFFDLLARMCYAQSTYVVSLYQGARRIQVNSGADRKKCKIIPNGVDYQRFKGLACKRQLKPGKKIVIGMLTHLVRVKAILNFIQAVGVIASKSENIEAKVFYLNAESEEYTTEIKRLTTSLALEEKLHFIKGKGAAEVLEEIDLLVVSSVSEGTPFSVLEAFSAGVPAVVTNVGACAELIIGKSEEDRALGASGIVVHSGDPVSLAEAILRIEKDPLAYEKMSAVALERVKKYYCREAVFNEYGDIYQELMN